MAVHHAHQTVELTLRRKAEEYRENPRDFPRVIEALKKHSVKIPYERDLEELNKTRVLIQHYGQVPDERDAYRLVRASENFMRDFCLEAFGVSYEKLTGFDIISNVDISKTLIEAQDAYEKRRFEDSAISAHLAIQKAKWIIQSKTRPTSIRGQFWLSVPDTGVRQLDRIFESLSEGLDHALDVSLSAPFAGDLKRLQDTTRAAFFKTNGNVETQVLKQYREHEELTQEDADFALELAREYVVWADNVYGLEEAKKEEPVPAGN